MKLRPRDPSSSRGKSKYVESSSNDDGSDDEIPSDSDYKSPSEREGEDLSNILGDGVETALEFNADDDNLYNVYQSEGPSKTAGDVLEDQNADAETLAYDNAMDSDLEGVLEQKPIIKKKGRKKKKPTLMWEVWKQEDERWIAENLGADSTLTDEPEMVHETEEPSEDLIIPLLRYQKEWLAWALKQEQSRVRGGILADEMGMGKTLQAIALVLLKRTMQKEMNEHALHSSELPSVKGTLVVCPLAAVLEWVHEIKLFTFEGSTKVLVYHGAKRENYRSKLSDYDFVITSYSVVEAEYRKQAMPPKKKCQYCGKLFQHNKLETHLKSKCGPDAVKMAKQSKKDAKEPTSKEMAGSETRESILHSLMWNRIILDEAHYIKSRNSKTSKAVFALKSSYKWALSGTPIQNRFEELHSLVRFLQVLPYAYYFCRNCDCRKLVHRVEKCSECGHNSYDHFCWWKKFIAWAIENPQTREGAFLLLRQKILKSLLLRRTKKGRAADLAIPPRIVTVRRDSLDVVEEDYYRALYTESVAQFQKYVAEGTVLNNYCHIFDLLTRLRQAVDHPYLIEYSLTNRKIAGLRADYSNGENCSICHAEEDTVVTSCGHIFCKPCLIEYAEQNTCPSCSKPLAVDFSSKKVDDKHGSETTVKGFKPSSILNRIDLDHFQTSTKIDALMEEIRFMVEKDGSAKGIVFSQFVTFLDLIHYALLKSRVNCVQLDGSMTVEARGAAVKKFTEDPRCRIFLMSLKAGGVALNLTVASHVFLMDPWWNPATERQAQDRIHRIGQLKPIRIVRFIIENTIEERILKLQEKKELVFEGTFGGAKDVLTKLDSDDISYLFGL